MENIKKMFEKRSSRMFLYGSLYALGASIIYFIYDSQTTYWFIPAIGYSIKGYYHKYLEVKFASKEHRTQTL